MVKVGQLNNCIITITSLLRRRLVKQLANFHSPHPSTFLVILSAPFKITRKLIFKRLDHTFAVIDSKKTLKLTQNLFAYELDALH